MSVDPLLSVTGKPVIAAAYHGDLTDGRRNDLVQLSEVQITSCQPVGDPRRRPSDVNPEGIESGANRPIWRTQRESSGRYDPRMVKIVVQAPPEAAPRLARIIESEGLQVSYDPPLETRSIESEVVKIIFSVVPNAKAGVEGGAAYALAGRAVKMIRARDPKVKARVEQDSDDT